MIEDFLKEQTGEGIIASPFIGARWVGRVIGKEESKVEIKDIIKIADKLS